MERTHDAASRAIRAGVKRASGDLNPWLRRLDELMALGVAGTWTERSIDALLLTVVDIVTSRPRDRETVARAASWFQTIVTATSERLGSREKFLASLTTAFVPTLALSLVEPEDDARAEAFVNTIAPVLDVEPARKAIQQRREAFARERRYREAIALMTSSLDSRRFSAIRELTAAERRLTELLDRIDGAEHQQADLLDKLGWVALTRGKRWPSRRLRALDFNRAERYLARAEEADASRSLYNLACLAALRGDSDACEAHLRQARAAGVLPPVSELLTDEDLNGVRDSFWFKELLGGAR